MMKLSKSQRIKTIQTIAAFLQKDDWSDIDLVLGQFSFPTHYQWSGDKKDYVVKMISDSKDSDLIELAQHFGMSFDDESIPEPSLNAPYWEEGKLKVFLSHISAEKKQAAEIQEALKPFGMSAFVAHNDIQPTTEWQSEIEIALSTCDLLVALIHPKFFESKWCDQEIGYALGRGVPIFTVGYNAVAHGFVSRFQGFNGTNKHAHQIAKELFEAAIVHKKLQKRMASILIDLFVNSGSFASAKARIFYLEQLTVWDATFSNRIKKASVENSQISGSWGVPEQVDALITKWK